MSYRRLHTVIVLGVVFAVAAAVLLASRSGAAADDEIVEPAPFVWTYVSSPEPHYVGVMEYGRATFTLNNGETLTTRAYRQEGGQFSIPGPTIHMTPGHKYVLRFRNLLDYEPPDDVHNDFKDPNVTNLHTHGLHVSGESPGDDVTRTFEGGFGGDYVYDIPTDHMGGTYWYHAHHHGSTFLQVSTGGFGFIIMDDSKDGIPANVAAMEERQVLIGYLDTAAAATGGDALVSGTMSPGWTVNGKVEGTLTVPADTWQHWRVLLADRDARTKNVTIGSNCTAMLLARDGVWRTEAPRALTTNSVNLTGASRADLAVRCSGPSDIRVDNEAVATIAVSGSSGSAAHPFAADGVSVWSAKRPAYLRDLRGEADVHREKISMGARTVNGGKFDINTPTFTLNADAVQEWSIKGAVNHPFHLHVYHFQAQGGCGGDFEEGEYYDTMAGNCSVRFDLNAATSSPYQGRTIMHCHILAHEDQGAMTWMDVVGGTPPPTFPGGFGYGGHYALSGKPPPAPSDLTATARSHFAIDLTWVDNSSDETDFLVERSPDGAGWSSLATVGADHKTYADTGLSASTSYWYRVAARNAAGTSAWSNVASATTLEDSGGTTSVQLGSLTVTVVNAGKGVKRGQATVVVVDDLGDPVEGANVTGDFLGTFAEPDRTGVTDASGTAVIFTNGSAKGGVTVTFCVTSITASGLSGWTGSNCESS